MEGCEVCVWGETKAEVVVEVEKVWVSVKGWLGARGVQRRVCRGFGDRMIARLIA